MAVTCNKPVWNPGHRYRLLRQRARHQSAGSASIGDCREQRLSQNRGRLPSPSFLNAEIASRLGIGKSWRGDYGLAWLARGKSGLPKDQTCWVTPSAGDREDSATETYRRWSDRSQVRVQRCGKSAPAASRGAGSVNPGREQGRRGKGWSFSCLAFGVPQEAVGNSRPR
jgi:hypothetical protein